MAIETSFDQSKRDFILSFARKNKSRGNQLPRRTGTNSSSTQPEPPSGWDKIINRRTFLRVGSVGAGTSIGLLVERLGLLKFLFGEQAISDKRKAGLLLENLDLANFDATTSLKKDQFFDFNNIRVINTSPNYQVGISKEGLEYWSKFCQVSTYPGLVTVRFANQVFDVTHDYSEIGNAMDVNFSANDVNIIYGINGYYQELPKILDTDYEITPSKKDSALSNLVNLQINIGMVHGNCGGVAASLSMRRRSTPQERNRIMEAANQSAQSLEKAFLEGNIPLVFKIQPLII